MLQFSLRNLLIAVAAVAVGTAALLNANEWWASLLWGLAILVLVFAGLVALFRRESQRAFWSGYLLAGCLYLLLLMHPIHNVASLHYQNLITTNVLAWSYSLLPPSKTTPILPTPPAPAGGVGGMSVMEMGSNAMASGAVIENPSFILQNEFIEVGHALFIIVFSLLGGLVSYWLFRTRPSASIRVVNGLA